MKVTVLTLFPRLFEGFLDESIVGIARDKGALEVDLVDYRDFTTDKHRTVDDRPYGGGPGMVIKPEPVFDAVEAVRARAADADAMPLVLLTPQGETFDQDHARRFSSCDELLLLCGRYEGFDERIHEGFDWIELSLGDFVMSGGEIAAMAVIEASARLLPGVLGHEESADQDSFSHGLLDHPHYTRPPSFRDRDVPDVLLSGDHARIAAWRRDQAETRTAAWAARRSSRQERQFR
ncbi:MAG: tRNA (guanosine(37)-N1)-methyltransferase TrmD [Planctomycetes bacterium]|nr:tRNA (guanosine(37)-N1)-methyltransferase TrmD [Planctomycetota bacterium]